MRGFSKLVTRNFLLSIRRLIISLYIMIFRTNRMKISLIIITLYRIIIMNMTTRIRSFSITIFLFLMNHRLKIIDMIFSRINLDFSTERKCKRLKKLSDRLLRTANLFHNNLLLLYNRKNTKKFQIL